MSKENKLSKSITITETDIKNYPYAYEFFNSTVWGKNSVILNMVDKYLERYGFVPQDRNGIKALETWVNTIPVNNVMGYKEGVVDKNRGPCKRKKEDFVFSLSSQNKGPESLLHNTMSDVDVVNQSNSNQNYQSQISNSNNIQNNIQIENQTYANTDYNPMPIAVENEDGTVDPFAAIGIDMSGIL